MPVRVRIPLPGPFVYTSAPHHQVQHTPEPARARAARVVVLFTIVMIALVVITLAGCGTTTATHGKFLGPHPIHAANAALVTTDPGVALEDYLNAHGAHLPSGWQHWPDDDHAAICQAYATGYYDRLPAGDVDDYGVTPALAKASIAATGFCG